MATTDNKIINGSGLSKLSSQIKSYVNDKTEISVGATAPTDNKIKLWVDTSATGEIAWNDITGKPDLATKSEVQQVEDKIPTPYTLPKATTSTLGGVMPDGSTITIADGVISAVGSGGGEPNAYIKDASVSGNTLTLTKKDNTNVVFTPSGGSSGGSDGLQRIFDSQLRVEDAVSQNSAYIGKIVYDHNTDNQYLVLKDQKIAKVKATKDINPMDLLSTQSNFNQNKDWVLQWIENNSYNVCVDGSPVFSTKKIGSTFYYYWIDNFSDLALNQGYIKFTDNNQTTLENYNNQQEYNSLSEYLLTSNNWQNYITVSSGSDWQYTQDQYDSNLYNAKELVVYVESTQGNKQMGYFNFGANNSNLGNNTGTNFYFGYDSYSPYICYDGSLLSYGNANNLFYIYYKT